MDIFPDDIELEVDRRAGNKVMEVRVLPRVGNDGHGKGTLRGVYHGQTDAVHTDGAFWHSDVAAGGIVAEMKKPASIFFNDRFAGGRRIDVALYDVTVEPAVHGHASLQVDLVTG